jgi:hypothetical protein
VADRPGPLARLREANAAAVFTPAPQPVDAHRSITASAERINVDKERGQVALGQRVYTQWQRESWEYYDAIGEIKYAFQMVAATFSRLRIAAAVVLDPIEAPATAASIRRRHASKSDDAVDGTYRSLDDLPEEITDEVLKLAETLVQSLGNGNGGMSNMLRQFCLNLSVAGECYLVNYKKKWSIRSTEELTIRESDRRAVLRTLRSVSATGGEELPKNTYIGRIWRMHPRFTNEPDSSMLALREMCDELLTLQRMIRGTARSQMNAGMLFIPDGLSAAARTPGDDTEEDPFEAELMDAMITPVTDEASAASVVPMLVRGPDALGEKIRYIEFNRQSDRTLVERAQHTLERILQGIDVPKDMVTGLANVKYSNAIQIDENLYRTHIEPMALVFCDAMTALFLRPALKAALPDLSESALDRLIVWYDPTEVTAKPDPATSASEGHTRFAISDAAWRRAHGFADSDAPDQTELARRYVVEKAPPSPALLDDLTKNAIPAVFSDMREQSIASSPVPFPDSARSLLGESAPDTTLTPDQQKIVAEGAAASEGTVTLEQLDAEQA